MASVFERSHSVGVSEIEQLRCALEEPSRHGRMPRHTRLHEAVVRAVSRIYTVKNHCVCSLITIYNELDLGSWPK